MKKLDAKGSAQGFADFLLNDMSDWSETTFDTMRWSSFVPIGMLTKRVAAEFLCEELANLLQEIF
jgi:hypothetical protein